MKILITGANGFIGSSLMDYLNKENQVLGTARSVLREKSDYVEADLSVSFDIAFDADIVIHAAALSPRQGAIFTDYFYNNVKATENIINYCLKHRVKKIVYFAAVSSYGKVDKILDENSPHNNPDEYGLTKYIAEKMIINSNIPYLILTLPGVVGCGCNNNWIMGTAKKLWNGQKIICYNKDGLFNNIVEISDLCRFIYILINKDIINESYILCVNEKWKVNDVILYMYNKLMSKSDIIWSIKNNNTFIIDSGKAMKAGFVSMSMKQILDSVCEEVINNMKKG